MSKRRSPSALVFAESEPAAGGEDRAGRVGGGAPWAGSRPLGAPDADVAVVAACGDAEGDGVLAAAAVTVAVWVEAACLDPALLLAGDHGAQAGADVGGDDVVALPLAPPMSTQPGLHRCHRYA